MRDEQLSRLPSAVALACSTAGLLVIGGTTWFAGGQHTVFTQLQFVLVAFGAGVGPQVVAGVLHLAARRRDGERRVEEALARMLTAAAELPEPGSASDDPPRTGPAAARSQSGDVPGRSRQL